MALSLPYLNQRLRHLRHQPRNAQHNRQIGRVKQQKLDYLRYRPVRQPVDTTPWSAAADTQQAQARNEYGSTTANLNYQNLRAKGDYGLDQGFSDPATNPFSRAALLERSYNQAQAGSTNSYAGQGQLYSGALTNAQNANTFDYLQNRNSLQGEYSDTLNQYAQGALDARNRLTDATGQAEATRLEDALSQPLDPSLAPPSARLDLQRQIRGTRRRLKGAKRPAQRGRIRNRLSQLRGYRKQFYG